MTHDYGATSFEAQFEGDCSACEQLIKPGQQIIRTPFAVGPGYHHAVCPAPKTYGICQRCFMEKSATGTCLCDD